MKSIVVLFTRDLRVHDHPALAEAVRTAETVTPLFVFDRAILGGAFAAPNRLGFLWEALSDLDDALKERGAGLAVRHGDVRDETLGVVAETGAEAVFMTADVSPYARRREDRLARSLAAERRGFVLFPGTTIVPADALSTGTGGHYKVFTPYWRAWEEHPWRPVEPSPQAIRLPDGLRRGELPTLGSLLSGERSPDAVRGGETAGRERLDRWARGELAGYGEEGHDDLAGDRTSRLSPYLHFGCVSAREIADRLGGRPGGAAFVRQLCWRDFHHQTAFNEGDIQSRPIRDRAYSWRDAPEEFAAWREGRTGIPIVDAGMRQLHREGWMHNRTRLIAASILTKNMYLDWRLGADHFAHWLLDADLANNWANWQWVAGTGTDTRPNRLFNPQRQAERFDPDGTYVRRYVPELAGIEGSSVHTPWELDASERSALDYPEPVIDLGKTADRFRDLRG